MPLLRLKIHFIEDALPTVIKLCGKIFILGGDDSDDIGAAGATFLFFHNLSVIMQIIHQHETPKIVIDDTRDCPFCAETIKKAAILCKHCKSNIEPISN